MVTHSGGIPGVSTLVSFLPSDALGVVVLINAGEQFASVIVTNRVLDDVLSLGIIQPNRYVVPSY